MNRIILWFSRHKVFTVIVSAIYFAAVVELHEEVSKLSVWLQKALSLRLYNKVITIFIILSLLIFLLLIFRKLRDGERRAIKIFYWCFTILITGLTYNTLLVVNVESIHFPQYALLSLPVFALTMNFGETILIVTLLGAIDEVNQFFVFHNWKYMDFNDIILNLIGAAIGALIIFTLYDQKALNISGKHRKLIKSPFLIATVILLVISLGFYFSGLLSVYPGPESAKALIVLSKEPPSKKFWIRYEWGKNCHVLSPVEGLSLASVLIACYSFMDYKKDYS